MTNILWLVLVVGYGFFTWAAGNFSMAALSFLDGGYLAFLCFAVLPHAMGTEHFFLAAAAAGVGVLAGLWLEGKRKLPALVFAIVTGCQLFWNEPLALREILFLAFLGGMGLYHASAGIIPDKIEIGKALISGAGFLAGTYLFVCL
ncbi:MAG: hypothetical protein IJY52_05360 [Anaerotignum sp.]|nr:hypothetical protein [Anaerotignum sp.]